MKSFQHLVLSTVALLSICHSAPAQQVFRCGNSYSQTPCAGAVTVQADDPRTDAQRAEAKQGLASDKALAQMMEATRRQDEAMAFAQMKAAQANQKKKVAVTKPTEKKAEIKKVGATRRVTLKSPAQEVLTATDGTSASKKKSTRMSVKP